MSFRLWDYYLTQRLFIEKIVRHLGRFEIIFRFPKRYISIPVQKNKCILIPISLYSLREH